MTNWNLLTRFQRGRWGGSGPEGEPPTTIGRTGGIAQERVFVGVNPQIPPDQPRQGVETPSRPARYPIAILTGAHPDFVAEGRFVAGVVDQRSPIAQFPLARQLPERNRSNIAVPPHVALGSLYTDYGGLTQ